jgi:quinol monooxygenase YgiN
MIIIEGWVRFGAGEMARLRDTFAALITETKKEPGCLEYAFAADLLDPNTLRIAERWESPEALAAHGQTPHVAAFGAALRASNMEAAKVKAYSGEFVRAVMNK